MNIAACEEFEGWLEVTLSPKANSKMSPELQLDIDVENQLKCGPVASRTESNAYGIFWTDGMKKCKLFFAFESKAMYNEYTAYLERTLRWLDQDRRGKCVHRFLIQSN